jgi:hypothetical protein
MIQTNEFEITKSEYFKIALQHFLRSHWWLYAVCIVIALLEIRSFNTTPISKFFVIFAVIYPLFTAYLVYNSAYSKRNKFVLSRRYLIFTAEKISAIFGSDSFLNTQITSEIPMHSVFKTVNLRNYWLLYITKGSFAIVPKSSFKSPSDLEQFEEIIGKVS